MTLVFNFWPSVNGGNKKSHIEVMTGDASNLLPWLKFRNISKSHYYKRNSQRALFMLISINCNLQTLAKKQYLFSSKCHSLAHPASFTCDKKNILENILEKKAILLIGSSIFSGTQIYIHIYEFTVMFYHARE